MSCNLYLLALAAVGATARQTADGPILLPLSRRFVEGKAGAAASAPRSYYTGSVRVGGADTAPQELTVFFDTGSGQVILDSTRCKAAPCLRRHRYSPVASHAAAVAVNGRAVLPGRHGDSAVAHLDSNDDAEPGEVAGDLVRDRVCLGEPSGAGAEACAELDLMAVTNMSSEPFQTTPYDGIVGLGLEGLSIGPEFSFFGRLARVGGLAEPRFALFLPAAGAEERRRWLSGGAPQAEVAFGGYNPAHLASALSWVPVARPEMGFWQVSVSSAIVGDSAVSLCPEGCRGVVDSSSSHLGVPTEVLPQLEAALALTASGSDGRCVGPDIHFTLDEATTLTLTARDYAEFVGGKCVPLFHPITEKDQQSGRISDSHAGVVRAGGFNAPLIVLGEPFLRRYYTVFDWEAKRIGFGLAAGAAAGAAGRGATDEIMLLQCKAERRPARARAA